MSTSKQVNVRFDGEALEQLRELERLTGKSLSDVLRESVNLSNWLHKERKAGTRVLLERPGEQPREVVLR